MERNLNPIFPPCKRWNFKMLKGVASIYNPSTPTHWLGLDIPRHGINDHIAMAGMTSPFFVFFNRKYIDSFRVRFPASYVSWSRSVAIWGSVFLFTPLKLAIVHWKFAGFQKERFRLPTHRFFQGRAVTIWGCNISKLVTWLFPTHLKNMRKSNWIISPGIGVNIPKIFELPPPSN